MDGDFVKDYGITEPFGLFWDFVLRVGDVDGGRVKEVGNGMEIETLKIMPTKPVVSQ